MSNKTRPVTDYMQSIEDRRIRDLMTYFRLEDYDVFVRYINTLGIDKKEKA
jgi:hypothetical protein